MPYDKSQIAQLAATLLHHRDSIEPHHVRGAVETAKMIVDEIENALAEPAAAPAE